jgi:hypothetical protein
MPEAVASERSASGRIDVRGLFYACRRLYLSHPERPRALETRLAAKKKSGHILEHHYFNTRVVPGYEQEHGEIDGLVRDARGHVHEAHGYGDPEEIRTEFVREFAPPDYQYDKVLYVEKEGIAEAFASDGLGEVYDMAIVGGKGYGTEAARRLLEMFADEDYQIFVLHDCDIDGFGILANMGEANSRMPDVDFEVIDLGLRLVDIPDLDRRVRQNGGPGMIGEEATRQKALPRTILPLLTNDELDLFTGEQKNAKVWTYKRFELNEIPADERMPFVERRLREAGVRPKVIPPDDYLAHSAESYRADDFDEIVREAIDEAVGDEVVRRLLPEFRDRYDLDGARQWIEDVFKGRSAGSWRGVLHSHIRNQGRELRGDVEAEVRRILTLDSEGR